MSTRTLIGGGVGVFALGLSFVWFWSNFPDGDLIKLFAAAWQPETANGVNKFALSLSAVIFIFTLSLNVAALIISLTPNTSNASDDDIPWLGMIVGAVIGSLIGCLIGGIVSGWVISAQGFVGGLLIGALGLIAAIVSTLVLLEDSVFMDLSKQIVIAIIIAVIATTIIAGIGVAAGISPGLTTGLMIGAVVGLLGGAAGHEIGKWIGDSLERASDWNTHKPEES